MTRNDFINKLGIGTAFALSLPCLHSCSKDRAVEPIDVELLIDLADPANENLRSNGQYIVTEGVVVARSISGEYIAATVTCSHNSFDEIIYKEGQWFCTQHEAKFDESGVGLNAWGANGLTVYRTELIGNDMLRVYT